MPTRPPQRTRHQWLTAALLSASALTTFACDKPPTSPPTTSTDISASTTTPSTPAATLAEPIPAAAPAPEDVSAPAPEDVSEPPEDVSEPPEDVSEPLEDVSAPAPEDVSEPPEDATGLGGVVMERGVADASGLGSLPMGGVGYAVSGAVYGAPPSDRVERVEVTLRVVSGSDPTTSAIAKRILAHHVRALRACYERALRADPTLQGDLTLDLTIHEDGAIKRATISKSFSAEVSACALGIARGLTFPKPKGGAAEVTVQIRFSDR